jgi:hypothetical protein
MTEDKLARLEGWEADAKQNIKEIEAPGITAVNAHRILELISELREAWADKVRIIANADERWIKYQHDLKNLREELAEKDKVLIGFSGRDGFEKVNEVLAKYEAKNHAKRMNEMFDNCTKPLEWDRTTK